MSSPVPSTTLDDVSVTAPATKQTTGGTAPYAQRRIQLTFQLASGQFGGAGNTLTISGLRTFVEIQKASFPSGESASIRVYGMTLDHVNTLTKAGTYYTTNLNNIVSIAAGDVGGSLSTIFTGVIQEATPTFSNPPDVSFTISAHSQSGLIMMATKPVSFPGQVTVEQALTQVLKPAGVRLVNNGVDVTLQSPYFAGGVWQQISKIVQAANCSGSFDGTNKTFTISPKFGGTSSSASNPAIISPATGMVGYPEFEQSRIRVRTLFTPGVIVGPQSYIQVSSQLSAANGKWRAYDVLYNLSAESPNGPWEMIITGIPASGAPTAPAGAAGAV